LEYAEHEFKLSKTDKDGVSARDHLEQIERQTGKRPKELDGPQFPTVISYIWSAFCSLSGTRSAGFSGPNPLSYTEIKAWMELTQTYLNPEEVKAVVKLDNMYLRTQNG